MLSLKKMIINILIIGQLVWLLPIGTTSANNGYIDVHVHLQGSTESKMLRPSGARQSGILSRRPYLPGMSPHLRHSRKMPQHKSIILTQEENLVRAANNLIKKMNEFGVEQSLVVVVPGKIANEDEYKLMRDIVGKYPGRLKLMAGGAMLSHQLQNIQPQDVSETDRFFFHKLTSQIIQEGAVGFGEMISYHLALEEHQSFQYAPPDHPLFLLLADIAARHDVPIDIHMEAIVTKRRTPDNLLFASIKNPKYLEPNIPAFERLLEHNRKTRIVWQHIGWDNTGDMTTELIDRLMDKHPNLYIALRIENRIHQVGHGPLLRESPLMPNRIVDEKGFVKKEWQNLIKKFQDRIVIGSDEFFFPVESERPNQSFVKTWTLLNYLSPAIRKKIGSENARRIYRLE